jgi:hypothetical protein
MLRDSPRIFAAALICAVFLPLAMRAAPQNRARSERDRLLRDESARLLTSRYEVFFAHAQAALAAGDLDDARNSLLDSLRNKPRDPQALAELDRVNKQIAVVAAWNSSVSAILSALERNDWPLVERSIRQLPEAPSSVKPLAHAELIPIFRLGAQGRLRDARHAAAALIVSNHETAAASGFARFVNANLRAESLPAGLAAVGAVYCLTLLASLYLGLRGAWRRTSAA